MESSNGTTHCPYCGRGEPHTHTPAELGLFRDGERFRFIAERGNHVSFINGNGECESADAWPTYPENERFGFGLKWLRGFTDGVAASRADV
jgi:hypothetical protein